MKTLQVLLLILLLALTTFSQMGIVRAKKGDTVAKVAVRYDAPAIEIARFNGLLPDSRLKAGREIRIPAEYWLPCIEGKTRFAEKELRHLVIVLPCRKAA